MLYVIFGFKFNFKNYVKNAIQTIENCHMTNVVLGKDLNIV